MIGDVKQNRSFKKKEKMLIFIKDLQIRKWPLRKGILLKKCFF